MEIVLYYALNTCALAPYVTAHRSERLIRGKAAQFSQERAAAARVRLRDEGLSWVLRLPTTRRQPS
jgi:hypothetical protein